jgi:addiction module HigA family antidote
MTKKLPKRGLPPMHPGELLRDEILPALNRPKTEIAKLLGVSRQTLYDILEEKQPVTPAMALRLGKLCGNGPDLWLNLQKRYDLLRAEQAFREKIDAIPTLEGVENGASIPEGRSISALSIHGKPAPAFAVVPKCLAGPAFGGFLRPGEGRHGVIFGVTLPAKSEPRKCLACALEDGLASRHRLVAARDDIDIERVELEAAAAPPGLFSSDQRCS